MRIPELYIPLGVYGCIDTFSRKVLFLNVCYSNSNPLLIGRVYLKYLFDTEMLPVNLRMARGTETGKLATIHVYLLNQHGLMDDPTDSIIYGPSTSNKIERWCRDLHERLEAFFKEQKRSFWGEENTILLIQPIDNFLRVFLYQLFIESAISLSSTGIRTESVDKIKWSSQQVFQKTCFPSPSNTEERIWE